MFRSAAFAAVLAACGTAFPPEENGEGPGDGAVGTGTAGTCGPGKAGCPCTTSGQAVACGSVVVRTGDYVTCSIGNSTCHGGAWGPCVGNQIVNKSISGGSLAAGGLHTLSTVVPCTNLCDPNMCSSRENGPSDVEGGAVKITDAGLTLILGEAGEGGTCTGLQCAVPTCGGSGTTSITGFVYDPAGINPLYNVLVYIPVDPLGTLPALATGATQNQCSGAAPVPTVAFTQTATDGSFTLTGIPSGTGIPAGKGIPIVVQTGEWRRELMLTSIAPCVNNTVSAAPTSCIGAIPAADCVLRLPGSQTDGYNYADGTYDHGDMPQIAIVTGHYDPFECLLLKIGISQNEFGSTTNVHVANSSSRRVHFFQSPDYPGTYLYKTFGDQVTGDKLWSSSPSILPNYDVVLLPCEGAPFDKMTNAHPMAAQGAGIPATSTIGVPSTVNPPAGSINPYANLIAYADAGGRVFATHYSYVWFEYPALFGYVTGDNWGTVATWDHPWNAGTKIMDINVYPTDPETETTGTIVQPSTFPKGVAFAQWLQNVGASINGTSIQLHEARHDLTAVGATSQPWMTATDNTSGVTPASFNPHFTFNTPYPNPSATQYGRVVFSDFHVSEQALTSEGTGGGTSCSSNSDCGFGQTCNAVPRVPPVIGTCNEPCTTNQDCASSSYSCTSGACTKSCTTNAQCTGGEICTKAGALCTGAGCTCNGCYTSSNCSSNQGLAWCNGATTGSCTPATPAAPSNVAQPENTPETIRAPLNLTGNGPTENNGWFPYACAQAPMLAQEKALEFMFFDLTGCVSPDIPPAPPPPPTYQPATFTQTFTSSCPLGQTVRWGEFDWQALVPTSTSIQFSFQSGPTTSALLPATAPFPTVTATTTTPNLTPTDGGAPGWSVAILDTSMGGMTAGTGILNTATPAVASGNVLLVTIQMNPSPADAGASQSPTLVQWKVQADCVSSE